MVNSQNLYQLQNGRVGKWLEHSLSEDEIRFSNSPESIYQQSEWDWFS